MTAGVCGPDRCGKGRCGREVIIDKPAVGDKNKLKKLCRRVSSFAEVRVCGCTGLKLKSRVAMQMCGRVSV